MTDRVCVAKIGAAHGLRGEVRLQVFTDEPDAVLDYGELEDEKRMRKFRVLSLKPAKGHFIATLEGVTDRNASEALTNIELFVTREKLPDIEEDETWYHADLIGLRVEDKSGKSFGVVSAVRNYGAGDLLEVAAQPNRAGVLVPFIEQFVPEVAVAGGRVVIDPPGGLFDEKNIPPLEGEGRRQSRRGGVEVENQITPTRSRDARSTSPSRGRRK